MSLCKQRIALNYIKNKKKGNSSINIDVYTETSRHLTDDVLQKQTHYSAIRDQKVNTRNHWICYSVCRDTSKTIQITLNEQKFLQFDSGINNQV